MGIAILNEIQGEEKRVALTPNAVRRLVKKGWQVHIESGAGQGCGIEDKDYQQAGAKVSSGAKATLNKANVLLCLDGERVSRVLKDLPPKMCVIGHFHAREYATWFDKALKHDITLLSLDLLPRTTRAQSMDVLSSQANLAGYISVIEAAKHFANAFPMMMTAAGMISPAKVFVMGVGVAGLQAIATARRLGAQVAATDVRPATMEQVESLGAKFVAVEDEEFNQARNAVYAQAMSPAYQKKQNALIEEILPKQDIVITTALIPGRKAPQLVSKKALAQMRSGSVIADLAAQAGGNCAATSPGDVLNYKGVHILGFKNWAARLPGSASQMLSGNYLHLLDYLAQSKGKDQEPVLNLDEKDEITAPIMLCKDKTPLPPLQALLSPSPKAPPKKTVVKEKTKPQKTTKRKASS